MRRYYILDSFRQTIEVSHETWLRWVLSQHKGISGKRLVARSTLTHAFILTIFDGKTEDGNNVPNLFRTLYQRSNCEINRIEYPAWKNYTIHLPRWTNYTIVITVPGWYLGWAGHWLTVFKLIWENMNAKS